MALLSGYKGFFSVTNTLNKIDTIELSKGFLGCNLSILPGAMYDENNRIFSVPKAAIPQAVKEVNSFSFDNKHYDDVTIVINQIREMIGQSDEQKISKSKIWIHT